MPDDPLYELEKNALYRETRDTINAERERQLAAAHKKIARLEAIIRAIAALVRDTDA